MMCCKAAMDKYFPKTSLSIPDMCMCLYLHCERHQKAVDMHMYAH